MKVTTENIVLIKSKKFAIKIVRLYQSLSSGKKEFVLSKQVLRSGTSIGANISESVYAQSGKDFFTKLTIASKEANETRYWLEILHETGYISQSAYTLILEDCVSLIKLLTSILNTLKANSQTSTIINQPINNQNKAAKTSTRSDVAAQLNS
jgi:four helix bundle protein